MNCSEVVCKSCRYIIRNGGVYHCRASVEKGSLSESVFGYRDIPDINSHPSWCSIIKAEKENNT